MIGISRYITILVLIMIPYYASSQELSVVSFAEMPMDLTARTSPRVDNNNEHCALLRVEIPMLENLDFSGGLGIVGKVEHHPGEYLVYLPGGTKKITIKHPDFLPLTISFQDYGIKSLAGQTTYKMILSLPKNKNGAAGFLSIIPSVGQFYKGSIVKGSIILGGELLAAGGIIMCENTRAAYVKKMYEQPRHAAEYNSRADAWETGRNVCIGAAAAIYVYNLVDAFVSTGAKKDIVKKSNKTLSLLPYVDNECIGVGLAFNY